MARVLIIEDQAHHREWVRGALQSAGLIVLEARDVLAGLQYAVEATPDLVLVSESLSGLDGLEVTARIQAEPGMEGLPILIMADGVSPTAHRAATAAGACAILPRNIQRAELLELVRTHLAQAYTRPDGVG